METPSLLLLLVVGVILTCHGTDARATRSKRNVFQLAEVISCETGLSPIQVWLKVDGYGCYCGLGGKGTPLDDVDRCCLEHDDCYNRAQTDGDCPGEMAYTTTYKYSDCKNKGRNGELTCEVVSAYPKAAIGRCAEELCECDRQLGLCLRETEIDSQYVKYNKDVC